MRKGKWFLKVLAGGFVAVLLLGLIVMTMWNWLVPDLFHGPQISFWQALGIFILAKILFGGWKGAHCGRRWGGQWKGGFYEKIASMTPEEREKFKQRMTEKWCSGRTPAADATTNV